MSRDLIVLRYYRGESAALRRPPGQQSDCLVGSYKCNLTHLTYNMIRYKDIAAARIHI